MNLYEEEFIDPIGLIMQVIKWGKHFVITLLILMLLGSSFGAIIGYITLGSSYEAYATVTVKGSVMDEQSTNDRNLAEQIGLSFMYMITDGVLTQVIQEQLGINLEETGTSIEANTISNTNMITIKVNDTDAERAYDILETIIEEYSTVTEYILGATQMTVLESSGIPEEEESSISRVVIFIALGCAVGCSIYLLVIFFYVIGRSTVMQAMDIIDPCDIKCLAAIPICKQAWKRKRNRVELQEFPELKEGMKLLASKLELIHKNTGQKIFAITSLADGEGKTTVADCLEATLKKKNFSVVLLKAASLGSSIEDKINDARNKYDFVLIDTNAVDISARTSKILGIVDATIVVVKEDYARLEEIIDMFLDMKQNGFEIAGFVLNACSVKESSYGYGYGYYDTYSTE